MQHRYIEAGEQATTPGFTRILVGLIGDIMIETRHCKQRSLNRNLKDALKTVLEENLTDLAKTYHWSGTRYHFFGRQFKSLEGLVLVVNPKTEQIITIFRNRDFPRHIRSRMKSKNLH